jgi:L-ascorbate metabolism protein UlaG (beta-lactamase superfamily)
MHTIGGIAVTLTQAFHSSSLSDEDGRPRSVGEPCGLIIALPDGIVLYDTGDTCVFGDMALLAGLYHPRVLMLPIGDFYTMGPLQAAKACELVDPRWIIPHHYGTFPVLTGTPDALRDLLPAPMRDRVVVLTPGEPTE